MTLKYSIIFMLTILFVLLVSIKTCNEEGRPIVNKRLSTPELINREDTCIVLYISSSGDRGIMDFTLKCKADSINVRIITSFSLPLSSKKMSGSGCEIYNDRYSCGSGISYNKIPKDFKLFKKSGKGFFINDTSKFWFLLPKGSTGFNRLTYPDLFGEE